MEAEKLTLGEERIRVKFNPSDSGIVSRIKQRSAELIDILQVEKEAELLVVFDKLPHVSTEKLRLVEIAQQAYEDAAMWAVKAVTA